MDVTRARAGASDVPLADRSATVARIALDHPACARVFHAHRIDFCCRGGITVQEACAGKGLDAGSALMPRFPEAS